MQILLSCAKDMIAQAECAKIQQTEPLFLQEAINNAREMAAYSAEELSSMLKINAQLGAINKMRYNKFSCSLKPRSQRFWLIRALHISI